MDYVPRGGPYVRWLYNHAVDAVIAISDGVRRRCSPAACGRSASTSWRAASIRTPWSRRSAPVRHAGRSGASRTDTLVAVVLGALERRKGQDVLLEAARAVPTMHVVFCGDGSERASLERAARRLGGRVTFAGFRQDVAACLAAADVVVLPSRHEGLGVAALEAMAAERPVVASRVGGLAEVVVEGETGVLVPPDDGRARGGARAPGRRSRRARRVGTAGRARVLAQFTAATMAEGTLACYERTS